MEFILAVVIGSIVAFVMGKLFRWLQRPDSYVCYDGTLCIDLQQVCYLNLDEKGKVAYITFVGNSQQMTLHLPNWKPESFTDLANRWKAVKGAK